MVSARCWTKLFYASHIFNIMAGGGFAVGAYAIKFAEFRAFRDFDLHITRSIVSTSYITAGVSLAVSIAGFLSQKIPNKPSLWILYWILISTLSIAALGIFAVSMSKVAGSQHKSSKSMLRHRMEEYADDNEAAKLWDKLQIKYKCCGVDSYTEWQDVPYGRTTLRTPQSCCLPEHRTDPYCSLNVLPVSEKAYTFVYTRGCFEIAILQVNKRLAVLGIYGLIISFINTTLVSFSCYLIIIKHM